MGATYDDLLAVARRTEETGFDAFFRSDHYLTMGGDGLPGPTDAWVTLAGLARETSRIRLGTLMTAATFRLPGPLAISVAQVDQMSGGRVELGIGAGWFEAEHTAYGIPFPSLGERFDRYEEQLAVITGLWGTPPGETFDFDGQHYRLSDSPALPKPVQDGGIPIIVGGAGKKRTPRLAARYAERVQRAVRLGRGQRAPVRRRPRGLRGGRPRPVVPGLQLGAGALRRQGRGRDRPPGRGDRPRGRRAARARRRRHAGRGRRHPRPVRRGRRASGSTCRCWTCPTSTTSTWWRARWRRSCAEVRRGSDPAGTGGA